MKFIVTLSDMVGVVLISLLVFVWIIFGMIILINIAKENIEYRIDKWKREQEAMKEWERSKDGEKKSAERIIGYYPSVRACVERIVKLIPLDENDGKVISMREYVDEVEKAFKRVSELKL